MSQPAWSIGARTGPVRSYLENMKIFACEGLICIIDERPGKEDTEYTVVTPSDLEERVHALNRMYRGKTPAMMTKPERQWNQRRRNGGQNCMECVKEARFMGDPSDPEVQAYWARHKTKSTVKISFSAGCDPKGYPELPPIPRGKLTGKTAAIDGEIARAPNLHGKSHVNIHKKPRKKNRAGIITLD